MREIVTEHTNTQHRRRNRGGLRAKTTLNKFARALGAWRLASQPKSYSRAYWTLVALSLAMFRAGGAVPVAQAMAGPIFETFQDFSSNHMARAGWKYTCLPPASQVPAMLD